LAQSFFDPESANFRNLVSVRGDDGNLIMVCGEVNARNRLGGYTGFKRFISSPERNVALVDPEVDPNNIDEEHEARQTQIMFTAMWDSACQQPEAPNHPSANRQ